MLFLQQLTHHTNAVIHLRGYFFEFLQQSFTFRDLLILPVHRMPSSRSGRVKKRRTSRRAIVKRLPEDVLLEIFDFCRSDIVPDWNHQGWYRLAHTCKQWRSIIFASASRLNLHLVCTFGTPVEDMLNHSPPFPLIVYYGGGRRLPAQDEEGALLALQKRDRVRSIDLCASTSNLDKIFAVMNEPFPELEDLAFSIKHKGPGEPPDCPQFPSAFQAPRLRHLNLNKMLNENGLPQLPSLSDLQYLRLTGIFEPTDLPLESLASCLSLMPQLEYLGLGFDTPFVNDDIGREMVDVSIAKRIPLPKLSEIFFSGDSIYLDGLAVLISSPSLEKFYVTFPKEPTSTLSHLFELLSTVENLRCPIASIEFSGTQVDDPKVTIRMCGHEQTIECWPQFARFQIMFWCRSLNIQVASARQICASLTPVLSAVKKLHLYLKGARWQPGQEGDIEAATWHGLLRPFCTVEKLQIDPCPIWDLTVALGSNDVARSREILPELCKLTRPDYARFREAFDEFIARRRELGQHIRKCRRPPMPWFGDDSEEEDDDDKDSDGVEDESESDGEEGETRDAEGERGQGNTEPEPHMASDSDSWTSDGSGCYTELDSDYDRRVSSLRYQFIDRPSNIPY
jgi:hypothetical protein